LGGGSRDSRLVVRATVGAGSDDRALAIVLRRCADDCGSLLLLLLLIGVGSEVGNGGLVVIVNDGRWLLLLVLSKSK
jgi:hypothetical protein